MKFFLSFFNFFLWILFVQENLSHIFATNLRRKVRFKGFFAGYPAMDLLNKNYNI